MSLTVFTSLHTVLSVAWALWSLGHALLMKWAYIACVALAGAGMLVGWGLGWSNLFAIVKVLLGRGLGWSNVFGEGIVGAGIGLV